MLTPREQQLLLYAVRIAYQAGLFKNNMTDIELAQKAVDFYNRVVTPVEATLNNDNEQDGN